MTEKRIETYWYDEKGTLTRKQIQTETDISTQWYPNIPPVYTAPTLPWFHPVTTTLTSTGDIPGTVGHGEVSYNKSDHISQPHG